MSFENFAKEIIRKFGNPSMHAWLGGKNRVMGSPNNP